jgi:hypothetical protein
VFLTPSLSGDNKKLFKMSIVETPCHPVGLDRAGSDVHSHFQSLRGRTSFPGGAGKGGFFLCSRRELRLARGRRCADLRLRARCLLHCDCRRMQHLPSNKDTVPECGSRLVLEPVLACQTCETVTDPRNPGSTRGRKGIAELVWLPGSVVGPSARSSELMKKIGWCNESRIRPWVHSVRSMSLTL